MRCVRHVFWRSPACPCRWCVRHGYSNLLGFSLLYVAFVWECDKELPFSVVRKLNYLKDEIEVFKFNYNLLKLSFWF